MTAIAQALRTALLHFLWQGVGVAFLLWIALFLLRKRSAQTRYLTSCAALTLMVTLPVITASLAYRTPGRPAVAAAQSRGAEPAEVAVTQAPESSAVAWMVRMEPWALPLWSLGVLFFSLRLVWACGRVAAMRRRGRPADSGVLEVVSDLGRRMGLSMPVRVLTASLPDGPSVVGWLRPVLMLPPATLLGLTPQQLEAVLAHELAHIRRYDHLVNAVQTLVETVLFYHPAVWWTSTRIREERELCCDDLAVRACGDALCFARALTRLERLRVISPVPALGSTGGTLRYRVQRLIGVSGQECAPSKLSGAVALAVGLACLMLSVQWVRAQEAPAQTARTGWAQGVFLYRPDGDDAGVTVELGGASLLHRPSLAYPETVRKSGVQGTITAQTTLDAAGNVIDAYVVSGPMELRKAVMSSIFEWHFAKDAALTSRTVSVTFQKAVADAAVAAGSGATEAKVVADTANNRVFIWNPLTGDGRTLTASEPQEVAMKREAENAEQERLAAQTGSRVRELSVASADRLPDEARQRKAEMEQLSATSQSPLDMEHARKLQAEAEMHGEVPRDLAPARRGAVGNTLLSIEAPNLSDGARSSLLSQLPVKIGETVTESSLKAVREMIHKFDEHLEVRIRASESGFVIMIETGGK